MRPDDGRVGLVVITRNRAHELLGSLARTVELPERPPVTVVDNGSTDQTAERLAAAFPRVGILRPGRNLGAAGRNLGVAASPQPYVAFSDDDSWWSPGALTRAVRILDAHPRVAVVAGHVLVEPDGRDDPTCAEMAASPLPRRDHAPGVPVLGFLACAAVVRRSAFLAVGGFSRRLFLGGEEELLACDLAAAGWSLAYVPDVVAHHHPSTIRDAHGRRAAGIRNTLWSTWLRRPWRSALWRTWRVAQTAPRDRVSLRAFAAAAAGFPWVLRERQVVPPAVEADLRLLDEPQLTSSARRYVS